MSLFIRAVMIIAVIFRLGRTNVPYYCSHCVSCLHGMARRQVAD